MTPPTIPCRGQYKGAPCPRTAAFSNYLASVAAIPTNGDNDEIDCDVWLCGTCGQRNIIPVLVEVPSA